MNYKDLGISIDENKCWCVIWGDSKGKQCTRNKKVGDYCKSHSNITNRHCGNIYNIIEKPILGKPLKPHTWNKFKYTKPRIVDEYKEQLIRKEFNEDQIDIIISSIQNIILVGIPGGGKSSCIVEFVKHKHHLNILNDYEVLMIAFNKNAQMNLEEKFKSINLMHHIKTFNSIYESFNKENGIIIPKPDFNNDKKKNDYHLSVMRNCLLNIQNKSKTIDFIKNIKVIIIDEAQDINEKNYKLINIISVRLNIPIIFVGDPNQCIYSKLRNSSPSYMLNHPDSKNIILKINYRSTNEIIKFSKCFQYDKQEILSNGKSGPLPVYIKSNSCNKIFNHILNIIYNKDDDTKYSDILIVTFTNKNGMKINNLLEEKTDKYGKKLKTNNYSNDNKVTFIEDGINIMTYYKSKCLEYKIVILYDFQEWWVLRNNKELDLNLKYVGITRAKEQLYMYYNAYKNFYRANESEFIMDVPTTLYNTIEL